MTRHDKEKRMATNKRSTGKRRSAFRRAVLASSSALALSASLFAAAPAQASTQDLYTFVPIRLTVHDIEDSWPDWRDEPRMYYGGAVWVDVVARGGYPGVIPNVDFTGPHMFVDLWERDGGWSDNNHLGFAVVTSDLLGQEKLLRFKTSWYDYEIAYKVVRTG